MASHPNTEMGLNLIYYFSHPVNSTHATIQCKDGKKIGCIFKYFFKLLANFLRQSVDSRLPFVLLRRSWETKEVMDSSQQLSEKSIRLGVSANCLWRPGVA